MVEIKWYARGGQGGFTASKLLGLAAVRGGGLYAQAFPSFGPERRGAPVYAFTRIDENPIRDHSQIYGCDYALVLDGTLLETIDPSKGIRDGGALFINTRLTPCDFHYSPCVRVVTFDAFAAALEMLGAPIANTAMLAVFSAFTGLFDLEALKTAVIEGMASSLVPKNIALIEKAYHDALAAAKSADGRARAV